MQLTRMYAATLLVFLLGAAALLRLAMHTALDRELEDSAAASAALVSQFFRVEVAEYQTIDATLAHMAGELVFEDRAMHVHRPDGSEFTVVGWPSQTRLRRLAPPVRRWTVPLEPALAPRWMLAVEVSGAGVAAVKARIDRWMALGIPALVLLAAATGWWLTGRSLQPVGRMADVAGRIVPGSNRRLPVDDPRDELGRMGTRFNALLDRLDGALAQQRHFLADAAHELRTPLARVRSRVELALLAEPKASGEDRGNAGHETPHEVLPAVHGELVRMSQLVDELLQLARADAGDDMDAEAGARTRIALYLDDLVTDELHRWHVDAERAGITLRCDVLHEAPITGDETLLRRLIGILLDNAIRYGRSGGTVDVAVTAFPDVVRLEVLDDGIGISPEERERVAERFFRGARARAHRSDGSGLGLAIASWIVQQHHGALSIEPGANDQGTMVRVTIPAARTAA